MFTLENFFCDTDVFSYDEDDMVEDPHLAKHLAHWGIDILNMHKVESCCGAVIQLKTSQMPFVTKVLLKEANVRTCSKFMCSLFTRIYMCVCTGVCMLVCSVFDIFRPTKL